MLNDGRSRGLFYCEDEMSQVSFDGGKFLLVDVQENPARYVRRLERAKISPGFAECLCFPDRKPRQLVIRRYGSLLHLAGWPEDGHNHARGCAFHKDPDAASAGQGGDTAAAIVTTPAGLNAKLDVALTQRESQSGSRGSPAGSTQRSGRRSASLLAFLQTLWVASGLNRWAGLGPARNWGVCNAQILAELGNAVINGHNAQDILHVMRRFEEAERAEINAEFEAFIEGLVAENGSTRRGIIIGEINDIQPAPYGHSLSLRQKPKRYFVTQALIEHAAKSYPHAWRSIGQRSARVVTVLLVESTVRRKLRVVDLAAMLCSAAFIPCDSIHEVAMANRLVAEYRSFDKPVRMTDGDDMLPDFVLYDTVPHTHIEVYGMNGVPSYEERKEKKRALRRQRSIPAVEWDVDKAMLNSVALPSPVAPAERA